MNGLSASGGTVASDVQEPASGLSITLSQPVAASVPNLGSRSCYAGTSGVFTYAIGTPAPDQTIANGTNGVSVACTVGLAGDGTMTVGASVSGADENGGKPVSLTLASNVGPPIGAPPTPATLTFFSPDTSSLTTLSGFPSCTLGPITTLKVGAMLADFDCPLLGDPVDSSSGCQAQGTLAIEYCDTVPSTPPGG
jgi:hypothetical protein